MKKMCNRNRIAYFCILLVAFLLFTLYVLFFSGVSRFSFFPAALGALTVGAILMVQAHGQKPIEIDFTEKGESEANFDSEYRTGDGSVS